MQHQSNKKEEIKMKSVVTVLSILILTIGITTFPVWAVNRALSLDGANAYVDVLHPGNLTPLTSLWSVEVWIKTTDANGGILLQENPTDGLYLQVSDGKAVFHFRTWDPATATSVTNINDGKWHHIVGVRSGTWTAEIVVDGIREDINTGSGRLVAIDTGNLLKFGQDRFGNFLNCLIDEVRIWKVARTQEEIQATMHTTLTGQEEGLVGYWNFDDGTANDLSPNGSDGILYGDAQIVETPFSPSAPAGEINTADFFNAIPVNQRGKFLLTMDIRGTSEEKPFKEIHITLPDEFQPLGARVAEVTRLRGDVQFDEQTTGGKSTQEGQILKVALKKTITTPGKIVVGFEAIAGPTQAESVAFSVQLLTAEGVVLIDELYGANVNENSSDTNGMTGIAIISDAPVSPPTKVNAEPIAGENDVRITWDVSDERIQRYEIYADGEKLSEVSDKDMTSYTHISAEPGATISYTVIGVAMGTLKSNPSEANATVGQDTTAPQSPGVQVKRLDFETVKLTWTPISRDAVRYLIYRGMSQTDLEQIAEVEADKNECVDETMDSYFYAIDVQDDQGNTATKPLPLYPFFSDVSIEAGVGDPGQGVGVSFGDYDNNGKLDIYVGNEDGINVLYHNNGDSTFTITDAAGIVVQGGCSVPFGDYDNDGNLDIYVARLREVNQLFRNNGDGTFTNVTTTAGIDDMGGTRGVTWGDHDSDGYLDIYVANGYGANSGQPNVLYKNNGDGTFTNVAGQAGVAGMKSGGGVTFGDYDTDGDLDLYVANLFGESNVLYRNNGDGTFTDVTELAGVGDKGNEHGDVNGHGVVFFDYDNDLDLDIFVGNERKTNVLYRNNGDETFTDVSVEAGIVGGEEANTRGVAVGDLDNNGDLDIYVANTNQANILYSNNSNGTFSDITEEAGVGDMGAGVSVAFGDYDNDGDLDIYVANWNNQPNVLYRNNGKGNNWLHIKTVGTMSNRDGIGARVKVTSGTLTQIREVSGGSGYCSQDSLPVEFGLSKHTKADKVEIRWPSGIVQTLRDVKANQLLTVTESCVVTLEDKIANPGDQFTISILIRFAEKLHSFTFDLTFDPSVLRAVGVKEGTFLSSEGVDATTWQTPTIDNEKGVIRNIRCRRDGKEGVEGEGILAIVTFEALDMGITELTLKNLRLLSPTGEKVDSSARQGNVEVYPHGSISGVVLDAATKKPIKGARVEVSKDDFIFELWTHSTGDGTYTLDGIHVGDFDVTVSIADYIPETISKVRVEQGKTTPDINIKITSFDTASTIIIPTPIDVGETAPDFTQKDIDGKQVCLSNFLGKPIVINFWESTSSHCRRQIEHLDALYKKYQGDGLVIIGINKEIDHTVVLEFASSQISYIALLDGEETFFSYGVTGVPCTYYIDKTGKVHARDVGFPDDGDEKMEEKIKVLLGGN